MNQIAVANLMMNLKMNNSKTVDESMVRHMILNSIRMYRKEHHDEYGEVVLTWDSKHSWRRDYYPEYKAGRRKGREESDLNWDDIFGTLNKIRNEIKENFPYKYMYVENCEADDIIAILTKHATEDVMIVSGDKDFQQLQKYDYVRQWSPNLNKEVNCEDADMFLQEHILKGDKSDGIPNILSNDDCLDLGIRQTPLRKPVLEKYLRISIENDDKYYRNYLRNQTLIDFEMIPQKIEDAILSEYQDVEPVKGKVFDYLRHHRLNQLMDSIGDFSL